MKYVIVTDDFFNQPMILGWKEPKLKDRRLILDGYFWTTTKIIKEIAENSTEEHKFIFDSIAEAENFIDKSINITHNYRIVKIVLD
jgi:hypothetical protein